MNLAAKYGSAENSIDELIFRHQREERPKCRDDDNVKLNTVIHARPRGAGVDSWIARFQVELGIY